GGPWGRGGGGGPGGGPGGHGGGGSGYRMAGRAGGEGGGGGDAGGTGLGRPPHAPRRREGSEERAFLAAMRRRALRARGFAAISSSVAVIGFRVRRSNGVIRWP